MLTYAEYLWLDGDQPTQKLRSKTRILDRDTSRPAAPCDFPTWSFDGSSTYQASGHDSDLLLEPVAVVPDPIRGTDHAIVLCQVLEADGTPHATNSRAALEAVLAAGARDEDPWIGFEQEYTLFQSNRPLGWPEVGYPAPQGPFYCGVGSSLAFGRDLVEEHTRACLDAGLMLYGTNAEVMPGQWEFQLGYRGLDENADPLNVADQLWIARWLLQRLGEARGIDVSFDNKPVKGDWNGAGAHTNFSTAAMRSEGGLGVIEGAIERLSGAHARHVAAYGAGLGERLTGLHETCSIDEFRGGVADRGASIRIPLHVAKDGKGYLEDRRPGANCDPYTVGRLLLETICEARVAAHVA